MPDQGVELLVPAHLQESSRTPQGQNFSLDSLPGVTSTPQYAKEEVEETEADEIRRKVGAKMNKETLLCHIDKFLAHYGPGAKLEDGDLVGAKLREDDFAACLKALMDSGLLKIDGDKLYWRDLKDGPAAIAKQQDSDTTEKKDADVKGKGAATQNKDASTSTKGSNGKKQASDTEKKDTDADTKGSGTKKTLKEDKVFARLKPILDAIMAYVKKHKQDGCGNPYAFKLVPNTCLTSEIADATHKLDGALVDSAWNGKGRLPVCYIYKPHEYKKFQLKEDVEKNRLQTLGDCHCIMNEDPRRMHAYAVSMEDNRMSVWYFSRSHSMKSLAFDWIDKDIKTCIRVFLAFARATPRQLGVDDAVTLAPRDANAVAGSAAAGQHFIYRCPVEPGPNAPADAPKFKYFKTTRIIKEMRPYNIAGRNTRIWKVVEVKGPASNEVVDGKELVLKDVWLETTRKTETDNLASIFETLEELVRDSKNKWGDDWKKELFKQDTRFAAFDEATKDELGDLLTDQKYKSLFLTKVHAWQGETSLSVCPSARYSPPGVDIFRGEAPKTAHHKQAACRTTPGSTVHSVHSQATPGNNQQTERPFAPKTQSRFIYEEVCSDLDTVGTLGNLMDVINQALQALRILFCAGWVHRDISSNNILAIKVNGKWKVKLSDLEFSRAQAQGSTERDPRTGTPFFMPIEILRESHLLQYLLKTRSTKPADTLVKQIGLVEGTPEYECLAQYKKIGDDECLPPDANLAAIPTDDTTVLHTFQHDLESIWWTVLYFITARVEHNTPLLTAQLRLFANQIFRHSLEPSTKRGLCFDTRFSGENLHPHIKDLFGPFIENLRDTMLTQYQLRQVYGRIQVPHTYSEIHAMFASDFAALLQDNTNNWKELPILPASAFKKRKDDGKTVAETVPETVAGTKRGRDEGTVAASAKKARV